MLEKELEKYYRVLRHGDFRVYEGRINKIVGMTVEATGLVCGIGDVCHIFPEGETKSVIAEVVGIAGNRAYLMPYQSMNGVGYGCGVVNTGQKLKIRLSDELIGRTVDALGNPIDRGSTISRGITVPIEGEASNPMERPPISEPMEMGVKSIDSLLTIGKGQRMGIFAGSGVGKSTLMGMIARNVKADVNVIALVGERGRELVEFINRDLGEEGIRRSVLVVATSDQPAMMRYKSALTATAVAEYFRDQGKHVLLMMDSLTRFAMAQREIGLSTGEAPVARGFTPSIYSALPRLLERSGNFAHGSITGIYTVLVEGDDTNEPVSDIVRGIIDGHIILSRKMAAKNHYPAIDVLSSISRLMTEIASDQQKETAGVMRSMMAVYKDNEDLIAIGAYKSGTNPVLDNAIARIDRINQFLKQEIGEKYPFEETLELMRRAVS
ncbi:MAG: FliI/YscN family ATPase [Peptococcaceae bacterium]|nr:FliI/YscN family ATPase [Peptococcaceae bacterium]